MKLAAVASLIAAAFAILPAVVTAQDDMLDPNSIVKAELIADVSAVQPNAPVMLGVHLKIAPKWHVYWKNPGESGFATTVKFELPDGWSQGDLEYPAPITFESPGPIMSYGYEDEVVLFAKVHPPANLPASGEAKFTAKAKWLMCSDRCIPGKKDLVLKLPIGKGAPANKELFAKYLAKLPEKSEKLPAGVSAKASASGKKVDVTVTVAPPDGARLAAQNKGHDIHGLYFFPDVVKGASASTPKLSNADASAAGIKTYAKPATISYSVESSGDSAPKPRLTGVLTWQSFDASGKSGARKAVELDLAL